MEKATQLAAKAGPQGMDDIDTDDEKDEEAQYDLWKGREMARIRCVRSMISVHSFLKGSGRQNWRSSFE